MRRSPPSLSAGPLTCPPRPAPAPKNTARTPRVATSRSGRPDLKTLGPWRDLARGTSGSINLDKANGFRFLLTYDTGATRRIEVLRVSVFFSR